MPFKGQFRGQEEGKSSDREHRERTEFTEMRNPRPRQQEEFSVFSYKWSVSAERTPRAESGMTVPQRRERQERFFTSQTPCGMTGWEAGEEQVTGGQSLARAAQRFV